MAAIAKEPLATLNKENFGSTESGQLDSIEEKFC